MKYVSVDTFSDNAVSKNFLSWNVERAHNRKCFDFFEGYSMFVALYITAFLPIDFVLKDFIFGIPFSEYDISYLCVSE